MVAVEQYVPIDSAEKLAFQIRSAVEQAKVYAKVQETASAAAKADTSNEALWA